MRRSPQIDGRVFVIEPYDCLTSLHDLLRRELSVRDWWRSFNGAREFAWFRRSDPFPFIGIWIRLAMASVAKALRFLHFLSRRSEAEGIKLRRPPLGDAPHFLFDYTFPKERIGSFTATAMPLQIVWRVLRGMKLRSVPRAQYDNAGQIDHERHSALSGRDFIKAILLGRNGY